jgi:hypothetical protein
VATADEVPPVLRDALFGSISLPAGSATAGEDGAENEEAFVERLSFVELAMSVAGWKAGTFGLNFVDIPLESPVCH